MWAVSARGVGEYVDAAFEPIVEFLRRHMPEPGCREFQGQRHPFEQCGDFLKGLAPFVDIEIWLRLKGALDE